jgi:hypothetical protein
MSENLQHDTQDTTQAPGIDVPGLFAGKGISEQDGAKLLACFDVMALTEEQRGTAVECLCDIRAADRGNSGQILSALLPLAEMGVPVSRIGDASGRALATFTGPDAYRRLIDGMAGLLHAASIMPMIGEQVIVQGGGQPATVKGYKAGRVMLHLQGRPAHHLEGFYPGEVMRPAPKPNAEGGYFAPVFITKAGNEILFNYPDMVAQDEISARTLAARFLDGFVGVMCALDGVSFADYCAKVDPKETYITAVFKVAGFELDVSVIGGPAYQEAREGTLQGKGGPVDLSGVKVPPINRPVWEAPAHITTAIERPVLVRPAPPASAVPGNFVPSSGKAAGG